MLLEKADGERTTMEKVPSHSIVNFIKKPSQKINLQATLFKGKPSKTDTTSHNSQHKKEPAHSKPTLAKEDAEEEAPEDEEAAEEAETEEETAEDESESEVEEEAEEGDEESKGFFESIGDWFGELFTCDDCDDEEEGDGEEGGEADKEEGDDEGDAEEGEEDAAEEGEEDAEADSED